MTIGEEAIKRYDASEGKGSFAAALIRCFFYGVVVKRTGFILLAEPVLTDGKRVLAFSPDCEANCWWVWYAQIASRTIAPSHFMEEAPYPLPYLGFKRRGKIRIYDWDHIRKEVYGSKRKAGVLAWVAAEE